jgi:cytochrome c553
MKKAISIASCTVALLSIVFAISTIAVAQSSGATPTSPMLPSSSFPSSSFPSWAYPWDPDFKVPAADDLLHRLPGSAGAFSWIQARDLFFSPDWHPDEHPPMPTIITSGRKPDVRACGSCHRSGGTGGPENSSLAGLSKDYLVQQMADFRSGDRKFSGPQRSSVLFMKAAADSITDDEVEAAAEYFSALKPRPIIKVVESDSVPKTYIARLFFVRLSEGGTEPLGLRIIEMPDDVVQFELRDTHTEFTAYVPVGSVANGEALAKTGGAGTTVPCATCHGPNLKGIGPIPGIAGRSPSYMVRQLYDFQNGARMGVAGTLMKPTVEKLSQEEMISLAAYVATLEP